MKKTKPPRYAVSFEMDAANFNEDGAPQYPVTFVKEDVRNTFCTVTKLKVVKVAG